MIRIASEVVIYILFSSIVLILNQFCPIDSTLFMNYLNFKIKCEYLANTLINIFRRNLFINHQLTNSALKFNNEGVQLAIIIGLLPLVTHTVTELKKECLRYSFTVINVL